MAIRHNNQVPNNHFHKDWQRRVRVHFNQPGRKNRRRHARDIKANKLAPRPIDILRPIVHCPTLKYNRRVRAGRGFSLYELKAAGIPRRLAHTIGIAVDARRTNLSKDSIDANVQRLKEYYTKRLILFPRSSSKSGKSTKASHSTSSDDLVSAAKARSIPLVTSLRESMPITNTTKVNIGKIADYAKASIPAGIAKDNDKNAGVYRCLRLARSSARLVGVRAKRESAKDDEAAANAKK